jgi:hypothetical protein
MIGEFSVMTGLPSPVSLQASAPDPAGAEVIIVTMHHTAIRQLSTRKPSAAAKLLQMCARSASAQVSQKYF